MFDISWSEFLLIGVVALIVIGPKELPAVMRTMGQWTRKVRGMASEFQNQFREAMREAEMADLKKEVDDMARDVKDSVAQLDPLKEVAGVGDDVKRTLAAAPAAEAASALAQESAATPPAALEAAVTPPAETSVPPPQAASDQSAREMEAVGAGAEATTAPPHDKAEEADPAGRAG